MSRSGYEACDEDEADEWHRRLMDTIASPEGQTFLRELAAALDALPDKALIADELIDEAGDCCAIGAVCKSRGIEQELDNDTEFVAELLGAPHLLVAEIIDQNDGYRIDAPDTRWQRMRRWVDKRIRKDGGK